MTREWETKFDSSKKAPTIIGDVEDCARADFLAGADPDRGFAACFRLADHGNAFGQLSVGLAYQLGWGVAQDSVPAHMWLSLAAMSLCRYRAMSRQADGNDSSPDLRQSGVGR